MESQDAILEIRLTGGGVNPQSLKAKEVAELLKSLEDALYHIVSNSNKEIDRDEIFISPVSIKDESAGYSFLPNVLPNIKAATVAGYIVMTTAIETGNYSGLPIKSIEGIREILKIGKRKNCDTEFKLNEEIHAVLRPDSSVEIPQSAYISGYTTIYPYIKRTGGSTPTVAMRIHPSDPYIYVQTSEENAKMLGQRLYSVVGMNGLATWERMTKRLIDFKIEKILDYRDTAIENSFEVLRSEIGKYWDEIEDVEAYLMDDND